MKTSLLSNSSVNCPVCGGQVVFWTTGVDNFYHVTSFEGRYWRCPECGFRFLWPVPSRQEISGFYASGYWQETPKKGVIARLEGFYTHALLKLDLLSLLTRTGKIQSSETHYLDIGCSRGDLLDLVRKKGCLVTGIEGDPRAVQFARTTYDLDVEELNIEDWCPEKSFDLISVFHVLEHVQEPIEFLNEVKGALKADGVLVLRVPNVSSFQAVLMGARWKGLEFPRHLSHFTPKALKRALTMAGFVDIRVSTWALRDGPPALASSILPSGEPTWQGIMGRPNVFLKLMYLTLNWVLTPVEVLASLFKRGAMITITCSVPEKRTSKP